MTNKDPDHIRYMEIELDGMGASAYSNFIESIRSKETRRGYARNLKQFLDMISDEDFVRHLGESPKSRNPEDLAEAFLSLAKKDIRIAKSAVKTYVKHLKGMVDRGKMHPNSVANKIKPIRSLLVSNEVDVTWTTVRKMLPDTTKTQDRAYTKTEIHKMLEHCSSITDKVIILLFSSAGFRLEAWDYFCWKDVTFFKDESENHTGAALCVYRGFPEEYQTFITPEACAMLDRYKEEWKQRFLREPTDDDPLLVSARYDTPHRLEQKGVKARVGKIISAIGLRDMTKKKNGRYEVALHHGFRKFFNTSMRRAKVNYLDKEDMMGHATGLEKHYERYQQEDFERFPEYQKAIPFLTISQEEKYKAELIQKEDENQKIRAMDDQIKNLKEQLEEVQYGFDARKSQYEKGHLMAHDNLGAKAGVSIFQIIFELMAPEAKKREIWKKIQKSNDRKDPKNDKSLSEMFEGCGELSWDNLYDTAKPHMTEEERRRYEENRIKKRDHSMKVRNSGFL